MKTRIYQIKARAIVNVMDVDKCWKNPEVLIMTDEKLSEDDISFVTELQNPRVEALVHEKVVRKRERVVSGYSYYVFAN